MTDQSVTRAVRHLLDAVHLLYRNDTFCGDEGVEDALTKCHEALEAHHPAAAPDGGEADITHPQYQQGWAAAWEANTIAEREGQDEADRIHDLWVECIDHLREDLGLPDDAIGYDPGETAEETIGNIVGQLHDKLRPGPPTDPSNDPAVRALKAIVVHAQQGQGLAERHALRDMLELIRQMAARALTSAEAEGRQNASTDPVASPEVQALFRQAAGDIGDLYRRAESIPPIAQHRNWMADLHTFMAGLRMLAGLEAEGRGDA